MAPLPAILIAYRPRVGSWFATAIDDLDANLGEIEGASTSEGGHPADALQALLTRRFGILHDAECAATMVSIDVIPEPEARP